MLVAYLIWLGVEEIQLDQFEKTSVIFDIHKKLVILPPHKPKSCM